MICLHFQPLEAPEPPTGNGLANGENGNAMMEQADAEPDAETRRAREVLGMVRPGLHVGLSFVSLHAQINKLASVFNVRWAHACC